MTRKHCTPMQPTWTRNSRGCSLLAARCFTPRSPRRHAPARAPSAARRREHALGGLLRALGESMYPGVVRGVHCRRLALEDRPAHTPTQRSRPQTQTGRQVVNAACDPMLLPMDAFIHSLAMHR